MDGKLGKKKKLRSPNDPYISDLSWYVYIIECLNGKLYTGITNDLERRFRAHQRGKGAWFTRVFGVNKIVYTERHPDKSAAFKREREVKKLTRAKKLELIGMDK